MSKAVVIHKSVYLLLVVFLIACSNEEYSNTQPDYVGSEICKSCHLREYVEWSSSHHYYALLKADSTTVLGDFDSAHVTYNDVTSIFYKSKDGFFISTLGLEGARQDFRIEYTIGVTPLQQYIVRFPNGQYQCLSVSWDAENQKWFDLQTDTATVTPGDWRHWTGGGMRWNTACADCHSTNVNKNFNSETGEYRTYYSEINVACEACHGPASGHVDFYQKGNGNSRAARLQMESSIASKELVDKCARCHSLRTQFTNGFENDDLFLDHYYPTLLIPPMYEVDGQINGEDYVYGSFVQSKMYHHEVSCNDCHNVHSLELVKRGNELCLTCHEPKYDDITHHMHKTDSEGSKCINCHMTGKTYMELDYRRDHSFRIPRPDQSMKYGTPNACNGCHDDHSAKWANDAIISNFGIDRDSNYTDFLLEGYHGRKESYFYLLKGDSFPDIVRATALKLLAEQGISNDEYETLSEYLTHPASIVRAEAINAFEKAEHNGFDRVIVPRLEDSIRAVRLAAAKYCNRRGIALDGKEVLLELDRSFRINADFPSGQHEIGLFHELQNEFELAKNAYTKAIELDSYANISRLNLALIYYREGLFLEAESLFMNVIQREPDHSYAYFALGLLYNELGREGESLEYLSMACSGDPFNLKAHYNYSLKLLELNRIEESLEIVDKALRVTPDEEQLLYVKLLGLIRSQRLHTAINTCHELLEIDPYNQQYWNILNELKEK